MNRHARTLSRLALIALSAALASHSRPVWAQQYGPSYGQNNQSADNGEGAVLPLPQGVRRVVGIDAQNVLLAELEPETPGGPTEYRAIPVRHVYVGGIAKLFGGTTISTEEFVSPAFSKNGGQNGNQNNGFNGNNQNNGPTFGNNNFNQNGFNQNGFNPNNGYPNGGYPNGGYPNGANPNGFNPNGGYPNGALPNGYNPNFNSGSFSGAPQVMPQVTYGVGNLIRSRQLPFQNRGYSVVQGR